MDSRFWTRLCYYCSKWSRPKCNNQLTINTPSSLAIALVSNTRLFEQSSSASSNYSQPRGINWNERRSTLQCGGSRLGHQQLSSLRSRRHRVQLGRFTIGHGCSVQTRHRHPFSPTTSDDLSMGGSVGNPIVLDESEDKENSPPAPSTPESVRPTEPPRLQRKRPFGARIENAPYYDYRNLFQKGNTVFVF